MGTRIKQKCSYNKTDRGWETQCGHRVNYRTYWKYCPICGKLIINLSNVREERVVEGLQTDEDRHKR